MFYSLIYIFAVPVEYFFTKGALTELPDEKPGGDEPLFVLIHGYMATPTHWLILRQRLKWRGFRDVIRFRYKPFTGSLETWSESLAQTLRPYTGRRIVLIGHSMGGLIALWCAEKLPEGSIEKIVTMGSPLSGTRMASFALSKNGRRLMPGTDEIEKTKRLIEQLHRKVELVCLWSRYDTLIVPPQSAAPEKAKCIEVKGIGHTGYHFDPSVPVNEFL